MNQPAHGSNTWRIPSIIIFVCGLCVLTFGTYYYRTHTVPETHARTTGTVDSLKKIKQKTCTQEYSDCNSDSDYEIFYTYDATVSFTANGSAYSFVEDVGEVTETNYAVGKKVLVAYNPENPNLSPVDLNNTVNKYIGEVIIASGVFVTFVGSLPFIIERLRANRTTTI